MKKAPIVFGAALAGALCICGTVHAATLTNGDLEQPGGDPVRTQISGANFLPGWTYDNQGGAYDIYESSGQDGIAAKSGKHYVSWGHLGQNGGTISQSFATTAGANYMVSYWLSQQQGVDPTQMANASVYNGATLLATQTTPITMAVGVWVEQFLAFTAASSTSTLVIGDVTASGAGSISNWTLDNISVDAVAASATPLPGALPLFASGLGIAGLLGRWRKRRA